MRLFLGVALALASVPAMAALFGSLFAGHPPPTLGVREGRLAPCPERPNCVASQAADDAHRIAPLRFADAPRAAFARLVQTVAAFPGARVVTQRGEYLHAEFTSATMGFVDDVEFVLDAPARTIHVRSASRLGYRDFGVNRERVEKIRSAFAEG